MMADEATFEDVPIRCPIVFVCEGPSDEAFMGKLVVAHRLESKIEICKLSDDRERMHPETVPGGWTGFKKRLLALSTRRDFRKKCKLVVVMSDNDDDPDRQFRLVAEQIRTAGIFPVPQTRRTVARSSSKEVPSVVVLMLPWDSDHGTFETLCFSIAKDDNPDLAECVEQFARCAEVTDEITKRSKFLARSLFSASADDNPEIPIHCAWRDGAGDPFPVTSPVLTEFVKYIKSLPRLIQQPKKTAKGSPQKSGGIRRIDAGKQSPKPISKKRKRAAKPAR